ncbi:AAA family ATPase [Chitinophaga oryziterrae]|uniref:AAA family ATPase n=1 Tax=Chitinophaga oryziterrae TaxID=1031224 RepID=A0A6N8J6Z5_9BACT|nr:AAA family ATPase [Chitinophaga oryziterrae]MVT40009.1 AAA family ATPase [Chitinophaga oryziterrae]
MSILIDIVRISNFRSLKNIEVHLTPLTLLVGANNAGKTTFLKAINLALGIEKRFVSKEDFHISKEDVSNEAKKIRIDVRIIPVNENSERIKEFTDLWRDVEFGDLINIDRNDNQYVAFRTEVSYNIFKNDYEIKKYKIGDWKENVENWEKEEYLDPLKSSFQTLPLFFIDAQRDILGDLKDRSSYLGKLISKIEIDPKKIEELEKKIKSLNDDIVGNSEVLSHLRDRLKELSNTIPSGSTGIDITPLNKKIRDLNKGLNINFQDGENESFPLEYHGMGTRSWASLLAFKAYITWLADSFEKGKVSPYYPILALEEPEAHLHPNAQRHLYSQLIEIKGQKIITSHSPYIAGQCDLEEIRHFYKSNDLPQVSQFSIDGMFPEDLRKLRREVMHSRGELLFAKAVVLFEGETEEQSLPIFGKGYWAKHTFELGINFVGVGGAGNYLPFIRLCKTFNIPWYILSDGEPDPVKKVKSALSKIKISLDDSPSNLFVIPNSNDFEKYLIELGYQNEIKNGIIEIENAIYKNLVFNSEQEKTARAELLEKRKVEISAFSDLDILNYMSKNKTSISPIVTEIIVKLEDKNRRFPPILKSLFDKISADLKIEIDKANI